MKERLKELVAQTGAHSIIIQGKNGVFLTYAQLEKLSNLIADECNSTVYRVGRDSAVTTVDLIKVRIDSIFKE